VQLFFSATGGDENIAVEALGDYSKFDCAFGVNVVPTEIFEVLSDDAAKMVALFVGASGQTADLLHTKDNAGNTRFQVAADGQTCVGVFTQTEIDNFSPAVQSCIVYNSSNGKFQGYDGTDWKDFN